MNRLVPSVLVAGLWLLVAFNAHGASSENVVSTRPIVASGAHEMAPPPPGEVQAKELLEIIELQRKPAPGRAAQLHYWHAGGPSQAWQKQADELFDDKVQYWVRTNAYMHVAIHDALVAARAAQAKYGRAPPFQASSSVKPLVAVTQASSYPCDHSVAAGAAATVLAHLFPGKKDTVAKAAREVADLRVASGMQYRSDTEAGLALGERVAKLVLARADTDGYERLYVEARPKGREYYTGKALSRQYFNMKPWVLESPSQFRSPPPPDIEQDMAQLRAFKRTPMGQYNSMRWEFSWPWGEIMDLKALEYGLAADPLRAAFAYALVAMSDYDNQVAHWDGKYTYHRARPDQYDTAWTPVFATPPSPSYPAGHGTMAYTRATVMSHLFPHDREMLFRVAKEANDSRFEGGAHFQSDNDAGEVLGKKIGEAFVQWARTRATPGASSK